jgi:hypothetical protein
MERLIVRGSWGWIGELTEVRIKKAGRASFSSAYVSVSWHQVDAESFRRHRGLVAIFHHPLHGLKNNKPASMRL